MPSKSIIDIKGRTQDRRRAVAVGPSDRGVVAELADGGGNVDGFR